jgi:hypothetical protein
MKYPQLCLSIFFILFAPLSAHAFGGSKIEETRTIMKEVYEVVKQYELDGRYDLPGECRLRNDGRTIGYGESGDGSGKHQLNINLASHPHKYFGMHEDYICKRNENGSRITIACTYDWTYCGGDASCNPQRGHAEFDFIYMKPAPGGQGQILRLQECGAN